MPETSLWGLIVGLILLALGLTYKNADIRHTLKRIRDELSTARSEITSLNEKQQKQIQEIEVNHQARIEECAKLASGLKLKLIEAHKNLDESNKKLEYSKDESLARFTILKEKYEKELEELKSQKIEPASTSSQPGPDDYHAHRNRSFPGPKIPWDKY